MKTAYEVEVFNLNVGIYISMIGIIIFIYLFIHHIKNIKYIKRNKYKRIDFIGFILSIVVLIIMLVRGISSHYIQYNDLKSGNYETIEGIISEFQKNVKNDESFFINDMKFQLYSDSDGSELFNSNDYIEKLANNKYLVKIYYSRGNILKVEYQE